MLNADKLMQSMESQIKQTKQEAANQNTANTELRFTSEPMTIKLPSNAGRPLMIDPRNQADDGLALFSHNLCYYM